MQTYGLLIFMKFAILKAYKVINIGNNLSFVSNENISKKKIKRLLRVVFTPGVRYSCRK